MPKQKTHSGAKKRFKVTGTGKIKVCGTKMRHILEKKSSKKRRALSQDAILPKQEEKVAKKLLNI